MRRLCGPLSGLVALVLAAPAPAALHGAQTATGNIVRIDPATGAVTAAFDAPDDLSPGDTLVGLTGADNGATLLYSNDDGDAGGDFFRLNPHTGAVLSTHGGDEFDIDGLSFETHVDGTPLIYESHRKVDVHLLFGFDFPTEVQYTEGEPQGGLGGDDKGRQFGFYGDGFLHEFPVFSQPPNAFMSTLASPASDISGLAFDGTSLYASTDSGLLYTLHPDTGAVLDVAPVQGGSVHGLGVTGDGCAAAVAVHDPVGCWRFGEAAGTDLLDSTGNGHIGTYLNGPALGQPGISDDDTAVSLDGVNDLGRVPDADGLDVGPSLTAEGWIKRSSTSKTHAMFNKGGGGLHLVVMNAGAGSQVFLRKANGTTLARSAGGIPADGQFHHVVATTDGPNTSKIYIDGTEDTVPVNTLQAITDTSLPLFFSTSGSTQATFDEFALYDQVLDAQQIAALHAAGTGGGVG